MKHCIKLPGFPNGVDMREVMYIQGDGSYSHLYVANKKLTVCISLNKLCERFELPRFIKVHKSYMVNVSHVQVFGKQEGTSYIVILKNGLSVPISRLTWITAREHWQKHKSKLVA